MNILIFEYITGGGMVGEVLPDSLVSEGELMLNAVANDFAELPNVQVSVLRDYRLQGVQVANEYTVNLENGYHEIIESLENNIDALLLIAPESDAVLSKLCETYSNRNFILINSSAKITALVSDKLNTYKHLEGYNIPQIPTYELNNISTIQTKKIVLKPRDGVGCEDVKLLTAPVRVNHFGIQENLSNYIAQPYIQGQSASLSLLCLQGECLLLSANLQIIEDVDNSLMLKQCVVNALERDRFFEFSKNLIKALPELQGYIGVDIIVTESEILLVEINPRLTTSYVGLNSSLDVNPAALILEVFIKNKLPQLDVVSTKNTVINIGAKRAA